MKEYDEREAAREAKTGGEQPDQLQVADQLFCRQSACDLNIEVLSLVQIVLEAKGVGRHQRNQVTDQATLFSKTELLQVHSRVVFECGLARAGVGSARMFNLLLLFHEANILVSFLKAEVEDLLDYEAFLVAHDLESVQFYGYLPAAGPEMRQRSKGYAFQEQI